MRIPFINRITSRSITGLQEHAEKVKECVWAFQQAVECYMTEKCDSFEEHHQKIIKLENDADGIKRAIRNQASLSMFMPLSKFDFLQYINTQDKILDAAVEALDWLSYRERQGIPEALTKEVYFMVDAVIEPIETLSAVLTEIKPYLKRFSEKQRKTVLTHIRNLRLKEYEARNACGLLKQKIFNIDMDPVTLFHMIRFSDITGSMAAHAENAADILRATVTR